MIEGKWLHFLLHTGKSLGTGLDPDNGYPDCDLLLLSWNSCKHSGYSLDVNKHVCKQLVTILYICFALFEEVINIKG